MIVFDSQTMNVVHKDAVTIVTEQGPLIVEKWLSQI